MRMQETAKIALAHSASFGLAIVDNASLSVARRRALNALEELNLKEGRGNGTSRGRGTLLSLLQAGTTSARRHKPGGAAGIGSCPQPDTSRGRETLLLLLLGR